MHGRRIAAAVVIAALLAVAVTLHVVQIAGVQRISHDDTISYLAATGHQGEFQEVVDTGRAPVAQWVPAAQWQSFTRVDRPLPLLTIARDLGHHDIHPPVYFWLLHVWSLLVGIDLWTGPALNLVLHALTGMVLWRLTRHLVGSTVAAWATVAVWASLPAVAETVASTRQYSLAALLSVAFGAAFVRTRAAASARGLVTLGALAALGLLTLYPFGLVVAGLGLVGAIDLWWPDRRRRALSQLGAMAAGGVAFLLCQPWLRETLARQQEQVETYSSDLVRTRIGVIFTDLPRFAISDVPFAVGIALLVATLVLAVLAWRARPAARPLIWLAVWVPAMLSVAYVAVLSPGAASEARYFSIALPYVALLPALAWPVLRARPLLALTAGVVVAAAGVNLALALRAVDPPAPATLDDDAPVVMDNLARGVLLRLLWDAPPSAPVYAADQQTLLETTDRWLVCDEPSPCHRRTVTLATQVQYDATAAGQREILRVAAEVRDVRPDAPVDDLAERYRLSAPIAGAGSGSAVSTSRAGAIQAGASSTTASTMITTSTAARNVAATASASYGTDSQYSWRRASHQNSVK